MDWRAGCAAVIPCLNEAATVGPLVEAIKLRIPTVLVVDDGSIDGTQQAATGAGARVLRHEITRGKGAALQTGWRWTHDAGFEWALSLDGDGQHSPEDIPSFFDCAERTAAMLVVGNRMTQAPQMPMIRRVVNRWLSRQLSKLSVQSLPDSQCGFRLVNLRVWAGLPSQSEHFEIESEILMGFLRARYKVEFVPIRVIYKAEQSKIHPLRDSLRWFRWFNNVRRPPQKH